MSVLAELLSKVQQPKLKREVAPNLKNIIKASGGMSANKKNVVILSAIFIISALLAKAESADIHDVDAYLYRAGEYEMKGDYSKALVNYRKALEIDKNNYSVMNNIAYVYLGLNLIEESIRYSRMATDINRDYTPALINLGIAYAKSGDLESAKESLGKAFVLEPDNKNVVLNLAILHERQGRLDEAEEYFSRLVKSGDVDGAMGLARVYEKQGKGEKAVKLYRSVFEHASADDRMKAHARQRIIGLNNRK